MSETLYDILELDPYASAEEIKRAFWDKAKILHPDVSGLPHEGFQRVKHAYEILRDSKSRGNYDRDIGIQSGLSRSALENFSTGIAESGEQVAEGFYPHHAAGETPLHNPNILSNLFSILRPSYIWQKLCLKGSYRKKTASSEIKSSDLPSAKLKIKTSLQVFTEDCLPVPEGLALVLSQPLVGLDLQITSLITVLIEGFQKVPDIQRASLVELTFPDSSKTAMFLVVLERPIDAYWGVPNIVKIDFSEKHDLMQDVLLLWFANGPFFEAVALNGLEIYRAQSLN